VRFHLFLVIHVFLSRTVAAGRLGEYKDYAVLSGALAVP